VKDIMEYRNFYGSVHYSSEDHVLYGKIIGINDMITYEGREVRELEKNFQEAVDDYLESCRILGKEPEKTYKGSLNVRLTPELHRKAAIMANYRKTSLNNFIKIAVKKAVREIEEQEKGGN
jgi:predicted HicB family RNase H-like nuclease